MTQSDNARPCNCDQAQRAEAVAEALNLTCAAQGRKLAEVERILLACSSKPAPTLRECTYDGNAALEDLRRAMLERPW